MLDLMRRKKRLKIILWLVIFGLALGMMLFFVPGVNVGSVATDTSAATVDGHPVAMKDFIRAYQRTVENYSNRGRNRPDPETLKAMGISRQVLDSLVTKKVIENIARRFGIEATPGEIRRAVESHPNLQDQDKFIGLERYKALLAANNISVAEFEEDIRYLQLMVKLRQILTDSIDVSDKELRDEFSRTTQQVQADFIVLKKDDLKKLVKPSEADLNTYFEQHKDAYRTKEKRKAQYLLVPVVSLLPTIKVTEQDILQEWNRNAHEETVEAAHILFRIPDASKEAEVKAKAEAVLKEAQAGKDFAGLARKHSEDTASGVEGGSLGSFQRGQMVKEFEDAAFALKAGELSGLVRTQYGYHIIKVLRHETPTLESSRSNLTFNVQLKKARDLSRQKAEEASRLAEKNNDLARVAQDLVVATEIRETGLLSIDDAASETGIPDEMKEQIFQLKEINSIGKVVEHSAGYAVPKLTEVQMAKPGNFAEARPLVEKDFIEIRAKELAQAAARKLSEEARRQGSLEKAAKAMGASVKKSRPFKISESPDPAIGTDMAFNSAAFDLEPGAVSDPIPLLDDYAVLQVQYRSPFDEQAFQKGVADLREKLLQSKQEPYFQEYISKVTEELEKSGKIRINPKALELSPTAAYY